MAKDRTSPPLITQILFHAYVFYLHSLTNRDSQRHQSSLLQVFPNCPFLAPLPSSCRRLEITRRPLNRSRFSSSNVTCHYTLTHNSSVQITKLQSTLFSILCNFINISHISYTSLLSVFLFSETVRVIFHLQQIHMSKKRYYGNVTIFSSTFQYIILYILNTYQKFS